jgi:hypothetical protein
MTSQCKIQTNRANAKKSSGPRTLEGKRKASGNSRKHGFTGMAWRQNAESEEVESFAKALCADQQNPALLVQARIIAENHLLRRAIRQRKLALMKRQMTPSQIKAEYAQQVMDQLLAAIFKRFSEQVGELPSPTWFRKRYSSDEILEAVEEYFDGEDLTALQKFVRRFMRRQPAPPQKVDEFTALVLAGPEIDRLEYYESRAWTRQMRAMRSFIEISRYQSKHEGRMNAHAVQDPRLSTTKAI